MPEDTPATEHMPDSDPGITPPPPSAPSEERWGNGGASEEAGIYASETEDPGSEPPPSPV